MNEKIKELRSKAMAKQIEAIDVLDALASEDPKTARYAGFMMLKNLVKAMATIDSFDRLAEPRTVEP